MQYWNHVCNVLLVSREFVIITLKLPETTADGILLVIYNRQLTSRPRFITENSRPHTP